MLKVISTNPNANATNVSPATVIEIIFSEEINVSTFANGMVYIKEKNGNEVEFTTTFSSDNLRLSIKPVAPLDVNTAYTVYLAPVDLMSGKTLTSVNGEEIDNNYFFDFYTMSATTKDSSVPNSYTDPLYNTPFSISTNLKYIGISTDIGNVVNESNVLVLNFNANIDASSPEPLATIEAETYTGNIYDPQTNVTVTGSHLYLSFGALQSNSRIYISVPDTLKSTNGTTLKSFANTYVYSQLSPKPFPLSRIFARIGYKSAYFDEASVYEASMEAMLTADAYTGADLFKYSQNQIDPHLSTALMYLTMGILITRKYLNTVLNDGTQLAIDVTSYKSGGMPSDLGAKYTKLGIDMLRGIFPVSPAVTKRAIRVFRPRWSNKVVFDPANENRMDNPHGFTEISK